MLSGGSFSCTVAQPRGFPHIKLHYMCALRHYIRANSIIMFIQCVEMQAFAMSPVKTMSTAVSTIMRRLLHPIFLPVAAISHRGDPMSKVLDGQHLKY